MSTLKPMPDNSHGVRWRNARMCNWSAWRGTRESTWPSLAWFALISDPSSHPYVLLQPQPSDSQVTCYHFANSLPWLGNKVLGGWGEHIGMWQLHFHQQPPLNACILTTILLSPPLAPSLTLPTTFWLLLRRLDTSHGQLGSHGLFINPVGIK